MTEIELKVTRCEIDVREAKRKLATAIDSMTHGEAKLKADYEIGYRKLKDEVDAAQAHLDREQAYLDAALAERERPFESN